MADKARPTFPVSVTFSDGELPSAAKLRAAALQSQNGQRILEYLIGDPWNQSGDAILANDSSSPLMQSNLARILGPAHSLNPVIPYLPSVTKYYHRFYNGDGFYGTNEGYLSCLPSFGCTFTWTGSGTPSTRRTTRSACTTTGDYYVDYDTGYVFCYDTIAAWTVSYLPEATAMCDRGLTTDFNVVPDLRTNTSYNFLGCKIAYANNTDSSEGYVIYLPPRGPLSDDYVTGQRGPQSPYGVGSISNFSTSPSSEYLMWLADTQDAPVGATASHYRYNLPRLLTDNWSQAALIPQGFLYLWDRSQTGTIIPGVLFYAEDAGSPKTWALYASGDALDTWVANYLTLAGYPSNALTSRDDHGSEYYPANGLHVITCGASVSYVLDQLVLNFCRHSHGTDTESTFSTGLISHEDLVDTFCRTTGQGNYVPSTWTNDWHPQYLHRSGINTTSGGSYRDQYKNGMWGDLLFLSTNATSDYQNLSADSHGIYFGSSVTGPHLYYESSVSSTCLTGKLQVYDTLWIDDGGLGGRPNLLSGWAGQRSRLATGDEDGEFFIESSESSTGNAEDGCLAVARLKGGCHNDTVSGYGYSGSGPGTNLSWGPIRTHVIPAINFHTFWVYTALENDPSQDATKFVTQLKTASSGSYGVDGTYFSILDQWAATTYYAFAHISLPYPEYCIVQVASAHSTSGWPGSSVFCDLGYEGFDNSGNYTRTRLQSVDLTTVGASLTTLANCYSVSTTTPLLQVNNSNGWSTYSKRLPWVRYRILGSASAREFDFTGVVIYYRIREW